MDAKNILTEHEKKISNSKSEVKQMIKKASEEAEKNVIGVNQTPNLYLKEKSNGRLLGNDLGFLLFKEPFLRYRMSLILYNQVEWILINLLITHQKLARAELMLSWWVKFHS